MLKKSVLFLIFLLVGTAFIGSAPVPINLSKSPGRASVHVSVLAYGDRVMVTWREEYLWDIYYTIYSNGSWSYPAPVFDTSKISKNPHLDIGPDGIIHITWAEGGSSPARDIYHAVYRDGVWQGMEEVYDSPMNSNWSRVGILADNTVNITWTSEMSGTYDQVIRNNWKPDGGSWNANGLIISKKKPQHSTGHSDIFTRGNKTYCVFREGKVGDGFNIMFSQKTGNGAWSYPVPINDTGGTHSYSRLAVDSKGDVHVLWENFRNARYCARVNGTWQPTVRINSVDGKHPNFLDIDVDPGDNLHAIYVSNINDTRRDIYYNYRESGAAWVQQNDERLSTSNTPNQLPAISVDYTGAAHCTWSSAGEGQPGNVMYVKMPSRMQRINVTSPAGGETWTTGDTIPFEWTSEGVTGDVDIKMRNETTKTKYHVSTVPYDSSPYNYVIPPHIPHGYYRAGVLKGPVLGKTGIFSIAGINITSGHTGKSYGVGSYIPMTWTAGGFIGNVAVNLIKSGDTPTYPLESVPYNGSPHNFLIPADTPTGSYYVKMSKSPAEDSTGLFNLVTASITVTSPTGGTFNTGDTVSIGWATVGIEGNVKLTLWKSDHSQSYPINDSVPKGASPYSYSIPCSVPGGAYYVKIENGTISANSANFTIVYDSSAALTVTRPNGGEVEKAGTIQTVTWTSTGTIANVMIEFSPDNGDNWGLLEDSTPNTGTYTGLIPPETPELHLCKLRISDVNGCASDESDGTFTIMPADTIHIFSPAGGEVFSRGDEIPIGFTTSGIYGDVKIALAIDYSYYFYIGEYPHDQTLLYYTIPADARTGSYIIAIKKGDLLVKSKRFTVN